MRAGPLLLLILLLAPSAAAQDYVTARPDPSVFFRQTDRALINATAVLAAVLDARPDDARPQMAQVYDHAQLMMRTYALPLEEEIRDAAQTEAEESLLLAQRLDRMRTRALPVDMHASSLPSRDLLPLLSGVTELNASARRLAALGHDTRAFEDNLTALRDLLRAKASEESVVAFAVAQPVLGGEFEVRALMLALAAPVSVVLTVDGAPLPSRPAFEGEAAFLLSVPLDASWLGERRMRLEVRLEDGRVLSHDSVLVVTRHPTRLVLEEAPQGVLVRLLSTLSPAYASRDASTQGALAQALAQETLFLVTQEGRTFRSSAVPDPLRPATIRFAGTDVLAEAEVTWPRRLAHQADPEGLIEEEGLDVAPFLLAAGGLILLLVALRYRKTARRALEGAPAAPAAPEGPADASEALLAEGPEPEDPRGRVIHAFKLARGRAASAGLARPDQTPREWARELEPRVAARREAIELVEAYERARFAPEAPTPAQAVRARDAARRLVEALS